MDTGEDMKASLKVALGIALVLVMGTATAVSVMGLDWDSHGVKVVAPRNGSAAVWGEYIARAYDSGRVGSLVLVGNVKDNPTLRSLWNLTGLPASESFHPHVIKLKNVTFVTGTAGNIYLTANDLGVEFHPACLAIFIAIFISLILVFASAIGDAPTRAFYIITGFIVGVWCLTGSPRFAEPTLRLFYHVLVNTSGFQGDLIWKFVSLESAFYVHVTLVLLTVTMVFYTAPKRFRELGFITSGLLLALPLFRDTISAVSPINLGILIFVTVIAMVSNFTFPEEAWKSAIQTLGLTVFTIASVIFQPWTAVLALAFVITFPRRRRNVLYLSATAAGVLFVAEWGPKMWRVTGPLGGGTLTDGSVILQLLLPLTLLGYMAVRGDIHVRSKGATPFLSISTIVIGLGAIFTASAVPYFFTALLITTVRIIAGGR
ncbi:MAG: hypothetical protein GXO14_02080 [Thermococci archaeon]|nr:hypothetical protein [Thermococci archaeon]